MKRDRIHILVVEDDATQGQALSEAFTRTGYQVTWCQSSSQAISATHRTEFQVLFVDCMLPKMNGVDLIEEILRAGGVKPKVFLFSGIFKDKKFVKDSLERTGALDFFDKPLDLRQVLTRVETALLDLVDDDPPLIALYGAQPLTAKQLVSLIERESPLNSIHLPLIFRLMQRTTLSGELTLINAMGDLNTISFWEGKIFSVRTPDKDSYFGGLAVSFGFVSPTDVIEALKSPSSALLGQKLISSFALSPHAIHVIMEEQLALRLSQTLQGGATSLKWAPKKYATPDYALNPVRYESLARDWVRSKLSTDDIRSQLLLWGQYQVEGDYHKSQAAPASLNDVLTHGGSDEKKTLIYLFRNLIRGAAVIGGRADETRNFTFFERRLDKLLKDFPGQNYFQILGVGERAHASELNKAFSEMKGYYDPANLPPDCPPSVMVKCSKVFQQIQKAHSTLSDDIQRGTYLLQEQHKRAEELLQMEPVFRAAILELGNGHPKEAGKKFQALLDRKLEFPNLRSYRIWAGLKTDRNYKDLALDQVPPEERHAAPYMMAKGAHYRTRRHFQKARDAYRAALALDPQLTIAKTELKKVMAEIAKRNPSKDILHEVTTVVENILGKIGRKGA